MPLTLHGWAAHASSSAIPPGLPLSSSSAPASSLVPFNVPASSLLPTLDAVASFDGTPGSNYSSWMPVSRVVPYCGAVRELNNLSAFAFVGHSPSPSSPEPLLDDWLHFDWHTMHAGLLTLDMRAPPAWWFAHALCRLATMRPLSLAPQPVPSVVFGVCHANSTASALPHTMSTLSTATAGSHTSPSLVGVLHSRDSSWEPLSRESPVACTKQLGFTAGGSAVSALSSTCRLRLAVSFPNATSLCTSPSSPPPLQTTSSGLLSPDSAPSAQSVPLPVTVNTATPLDVPPFPSPCPVIATITARASRPIIPPQITGVEPPTSDSLRLLQETSSLSSSPFIATHVLCARCRPRQPRQSPSPSLMLTAINERAHACYLLPTTSSPSQLRLHPSPPPSHTTVTSYGFGHPSSPYHVLGPIVTTSHSRPREASLSSPTRLLSPSLSVSFLILISSYGLDRPSTPLPILIILVNALDVRFPWWMDCGVDLMVWWTAWLACLARPLPVTRVGVRGPPVQAWSPRTRAHVRLVIRSAQVCLEPSMLAMACWPHVHRGTISVSGAHGGALDHEFSSVRAHTWLGSSSPQLPSESPPQPPRDASFSTPNLPQYTRTALDQGGGGYIIYIIDHTLTNTVLSSVHALLPIAAGGRFIIPVTASASADTSSFILPITASASADTTSVTATTSAQTTAASVTAAHVTSALTVSSEAGHCQPRLAHMHYLIPHTCAVIDTASLIVSAAIEIATVASIVCLICAVIRRPLAANYITWRQSTTVSRGGSAGILFTVTGLLPLVSASVDSLDDVAAASKVAAVGCPNRNTTTTFLYVGPNTDAAPLRFLKCSETRVLYVDTLTWLKNLAIIEQFEQLRKSVNESERAKPVWNTLFDSLFECVPKLRQRLLKDYEDPRFKPFANCTGGEVQPIHMRILQHELLENFAKIRRCAPEAGLADLRLLSSNIEASIGELVSPHASPPKLVIEFESAGVRRELTYLASGIETIDLKAALTDANGVFHPISTFVKIGVGFPLQDAESAICDQFAAGQRLFTTHLRLLHLPRYKTKSSCWEPLRLGSGYRGPRGANQSDHSCNPRSDCCENEHSRMTWRTTVARAR